MEPENKVYEYTTFPRQFLAYKWFKPLLVGLLTAAFMGVANAILAGLGFALLGGDQVALNHVLDRNSAEFYQGLGVVIALGSVACMIPAVALAALIVKDRPFSSYSSSRGGFNWGAYFKYLVVSFVVFGALMAVFSLVSPDTSGDGANKFTIVGFIVLAVLVLFQGAGEEYVFRGLIMQTIGSWTKLPVLAIVASSLLFAVAHSYNIYGIIAVFVDGLVFAIIAWYTKGLEVSCAAHGAHNFLVLAMTGFGFAGADSGGIEALMQVIIMEVVFVAIVILIEKKFHWCKPKGDGVSAFNDKYRAKMNAEEAAKQQGNAE